MSNDHDERGGANLREPMEWTDALLRADTPAAGSMPADDLDTVELLAVSLRARLCVMASEVATMPPTHACFRTGAYAVLKSLQECWSVLGFMLDHIGEHRAGRGGEDPRRDALMLMILRTREELRKDDDARAEAEAGVYGLAEMGDTNRGSGRARAERRRAEARGSFAARPPRTGSAD